MDKVIKNAIYQALEEAMRRESAAFNFYIKSAGLSPYRETTSLFLQLAEEERRHRAFIKKEMDRIRSIISAPKSRKSASGEDVSYQIPDYPEMRRIQPLPFVDMIMVSLPTELLSGDHLDTFVIENEKTSPSLGIFLHDVMGHGPGSAQISALVKQTIGEELERWHSGYMELDLLQPEKLMTRLNKRIYPECQRETKFVTAFNGIINYEKKVFSYTSAGQEPPLLFKKDGGYVHLDVTELVMGADDQIGYSSVDMPIDEGDVIVLFSDGITEICNRQEEMFERERLIKSVQMAHGKTAKEIVNQIFHCLRQHVQGRLITDDFSLAVLKIVDRKK